MKLSSLLGLVALGCGQESSGFTGQVSVEDGGILKDGCGEGKFLSKVIYFEIYFKPINGSSLNLAMKRKLNY